jgi:hypothetical protein
MHTEWTPYQVADWMETVDSIFGRHRQDIIDLGVSGELLEILVNDDASLVEIGIKAKIYYPRIRKAFRELKSSARSLPTRVLASAPEADVICCAEGSAMASKTAANESYLAQHNGLEIGQNVAPESISTVANKPPASFKGGAEAADTIADFATPLAAAFRVGESQQIEAKLKGVADKEEAIALLTEIQVDTQNQQACDQQQQQHSAASAPPVLKSRVQFYDIDGDPGSFRLFSNSSYASGGGGEEADHILQLWYGNRARGEASEVIVQREICLVEWKSDGQVRPPPPML